MNRLCPRGVLLLLALVAPACGPGAPGEPSFTVGGQVTDGEEGLAGAQVRLVPVAEPGAVRHADTGVGGRFAFAGVPARTYLLEVEHPQFLPLVTPAFPVTADATDLQLVLDPVVEVRRTLGGRVSGETPFGVVLPLAGATMAAETPGGVPVGAAQATAGDGSFAVEVAPGTYRLRAASPGYQELLTGDLDVTAADQEGLDLVLHPVADASTFAVGGRVDDGAAPVGGVAVTLRGGGGEALLAVTTADGWYAFLGVPAGTWRLDLEKLGYRPAAVPDFALDEDLRLDVTLIPEVVDTFRFAVQADLHVYRSGAIPVGLRSIVRGTIEHVRPSFVIFAGDLTSGTTSEPTDVASVDDYWDSVFSALAGYVPANVFFFPSRGNHDYYNEAQRTVYHERWGDHAVPGISIVGDPAGYYAFDLGNSHFTVLAANTTSLGATQTDWLREDLAAASWAAHRFVIGHLPLVSEMASPHGVVSGTTSDDVPLSTVLEDGAITAYFCGHEHAYVDHPGALPGVRQVMVGTAAATYHYELADGTWQELTPTMAVVDVAGDQVTIHGVRDAPTFTTTWTGETIPDPPPRLLRGPAPPVVDLLVVDGWQRGRLAERAVLAERGHAMFDGLGGLSAGVVSQAAVAGGVVDLAGHDAVIWLLSNESSEDESFSALEQSLVADLVAGGGRLVVSGSEVGWDLVEQGGGPEFYATVLGAAYLGDDAGTGVVTGAPGTPFAGLSVGFDESADPHRYPDEIAPAGDAEVLMTYATGEAAAVGWRSGAGGVVYLAFAIDGLDDADDRRAVAAAALTYLGL